MRGHGLGFQEVCDPAGDVGTEPTSRRPPAGPQRAVGRTDSSRPAGTLRVFYLRPSVPSGGHGALSQSWSALGPTTGPPPPTCPNHGHLRRTQNPELKRASELEKSRPRAPFQLPGQHSLSREDEHGSLRTEPSRRSEGCCVVWFQRRQRGRERPRLQGSLRGVAVVQSRHLLSVAPVPPGAETGTRGSHPHPGEHRIAARVAWSSFRPEPASSTHQASPQSQASGNSPRPSLPRN